MSSLQTISIPVKYTGQVDSTSTETGTVIINGGVGISGDLYTNNINVVGTANFTGDITTFTQSYDDNSTKVATTEHVYNAIHTQNKIMNAPNGFENQTDSNIIYDPSTQTLSISPTSTQFNIWFAGIQYKYTTTQSLAHNATAGIYYYYFDNTGLNVSADFPTFGTVTMCAIIYYYNTSIGFAMEGRYACVMDSATYTVIRKKIGCYVDSGLSIAGYTLSPSGPTDANNQITLSSGIFSDGTLLTQISALGAGSYTVNQLTGTNAQWYYTTQTVPFNYATNGYIQYNQYTGGSWQLTELANNTYVNYYVIIVPSLSNNTQVFIKPGQATYSTLDAARSESVSSMTFSNSAPPEFYIMYQLIFRTSNTYNNLGKCRIEAVQTINTSPTTIMAASTINNHNSLLGLQSAGTGVVWGHISDQSQNVAGIKTFIDTSVSTTITTGALIVNGGIGIAKNMHLGDTLTIHNNSDSTKYANITVDAGGDMNINCSGNVLNFDQTDTIHVLSTTQSTSTDTGSLIINGGLGVSKNIYTSSINSTTAYTRNAYPQCVSGFNFNASFGGNWVQFYVYNVLGTRQSNIWKGYSNLLGHNEVGLVFAADGTYSRVMIKKYGDWTAPQLRFYWKTGEIRCYGKTNFGSYISCSGINLLNDITFLDCGNGTDPNNIDGTYTIIADTANAASWNESIGSEIIQDTTISTNTLTGALTVSGGVGIAKNMHLGDALTIHNNTDNTKYTTLTVDTGGCMSIDCSGNDLNFANTDIVHVLSTTLSTSTDTGALIVSGGIGISKQMHLGDTLTIHNVSDGTKTTTMTVDTGGDMTIDCSGNDFNFANTDAIHILNTTSSTSTTTGALTINGGVGIGGTIYTNNIFSDTAMNIQTLGTNTLTVNNSVVSGSGNSNTTFIATLSKTLNADYGLGSLVPIATSGTYSITNGKLVLSTGASVSFSAVGNAGMTQSGAIKFKYTPMYSSVSSNVTIFSIKQDSGNNNMISLWNNTNQRLGFSFYNSDGSTIMSTEFSSFTPVNGQEYEFELNFDITNGNTRMKIDGVSYGMTYTNTGTRTNTCTILQIGTAGTSFAIRDFMIYNNIQHLSNYTPGYSLSAPLTVYGNEILNGSLYSSNAYIMASTASTSSDTGSLTVAGGIGCKQIVRDTDNLYSNGLVFSASYSSQIVPDYCSSASSTYAITTSTNGTPSISSGALLFPAKTCITYHLIPEMTNGSIGCIRFTIIPQYSGAPVGNSTYYFTQAYSGGVNGMFMYHATNGNIYLQLYDSTNTLIFNTIVFSFSPISGTEYEFEVDYDFTNGNTNVFLDGILKATLTNTATRTSINYIVVSNGINTTIQAYKNFLIFNNIQHTSSYTKSTFTYPLSTIVGRQIISGINAYDTTSGALHIDGGESITNDLRIGGNIYSYNGNSLNRKCFTNKDLASRAVSTWATGTLPNSYNWMSVCWCPKYGMFVACANASIFLRSYDGINWLSSTGVAKEWRNICWSPELSMFCVVALAGTACILISNDAITWTLITVPADVGWWGVCWSPELGIFCCSGTTAGTTTGIMTSPDGTNWTLQTTPSPAGNSICWSSELHMFCSSSGLRSYDGINWLSTTAPTMQNVCWAPELSMFCGVAYTLGAYTSNDGIIWTSRGAPVANNWYSIVWSPELGIFCAGAITGTGNRIMTSPDGINWTTQSPPSDLTHRSMCWSPELGVFCTLGMTSTVSMISKCVYTQYSKNKVDGVITYTSTIDATRTDTGTLIVPGGVGISKTLYVGNQINVVGTGNGINVTNASTSYTSTLVMQNTSGSYPIYQIIEGGSANATSGVGAGVLGIYESANSMAGFAINASGKKLLCNYTTQSTNTSTGALIVSGGLGLNGNLHSNGNMYIDNNAGVLQFSNAALKKRIVLWDSNNDTTRFYGFGIQTSELRYQVEAITTHHSFYAGTGSGTDQQLMKIEGDLAKGVNIYHTAVATSITTGSMVVAGGVGIGGSLYVGGTTYTPNASMSGTLTVDQLQEYNSGQGIEIIAGTDVYIRDTTDSGSANTGALQIAGGASIAKQLYVGDKISVSTATTNAISITHTGVATASGSSRAISFLKPLMGTGEVAQLQFGMAGAVRNAGYIGFVYSGTSGSTENYMTLELDSVAKILNIYPYKITNTITTDATALNTGALQVAGGVSITKQTYLGNTLTIAASAVPMINTNCSSAASAGSWISATNCFKATMGANETYFHQVGLASSTLNSAYYGFTYSGTSGSANNYASIELAGYGNLLDVYSNKITSIITTASTSATTGALILAGGLGVASNIHSNGSIYVDSSTGVLQFSNDVSKKRLVLYDIYADTTRFYGLGIQSQELRYQVDATASHHSFYAGIGSGTEQQLMRIEGDLAKGVNIYHTTASTSATTGSLILAGGLGVGGAINAYNTGALAYYACDCTGKLSTEISDHFTGKILQSGTTTTLYYPSGTYYFGGQTTYYAIRFSGWVKPAYSETYTFTYSADDHAKLYINNIYVATGGTVAFTANAWVPIIVELVNGPGLMSLRVQWASTSQTIQDIPAANMAYDHKSIPPPVLGSTVVAGGMYINSGYSYIYTYGYLNTAGKVGTSTASVATMYSLQCPNGRILCTEFNAVSDRRIKNNITPFSDKICYDLTNRIEQKHYTRVDESVPKIGFIAQELEEIIPNCVSKIDSRGYKDFRIVDHNQLIAVHNGAIRHISHKQRMNNIDRYQITTTECKSAITLPDEYMNSIEKVQVFISPIESFGIGYGKYNSETNVVDIVVSQDGDYNVMVICSSIE